jgi:hypothetical protein
MAGDHLVQVKELFQLYDSDADNSLSLNELLKLLEEAGTRSRITSLPATAQVAAQQGKYLGKKLHKLSVANPPKLSSPIPPLADSATRLSRNGRIMIISGPTPEGHDEHDLACPTTCQRRPQPP